MGRLSKLLGAVVGVVAVTVVVKSLMERDSENWITEDGTLIEKDDEGTWFTDEYGTRGPYE